MLKNQKKYVLVANLKKAKADTIPEPIKDAACIQKLFFSFAYWYILPNFVFFAIHVHKI